MRGYTLIEVILVVTIIAFMSVVGMTKFNQFKQDTDIDLASEGFVSEIRTAKNMSMSGMIEDGKDASYYESDGLPEYGVDNVGSGYKLFRDYKLSGGISKTDYLEEIQLDPSITITGDNQIKFTRINGETGGAIFVMQKTGVSEKRQINIDSKGVITVTKI